MFKSHRDVKYVSESHVSDVKAADYRPTCLVVESVDKNMVRGTVGCGEDHSISEVWLCV